MRLVYQPLVCLRTGEIAGFESLIRWQHPTEGNIRPDLFIPSAEKNKAVSEVLNRFVISSACQQAQEWRSWLGDRFLGVNISPASLQDVTESALPEALENTGCPPSLIKVELTERRPIPDALVDFYGGYIDRLHVDLHIGGVHLDDFGTQEHRGLRLLRNHKISGVKIDISLMPQNSEDSVAIAIYSGLVLTAKMLQIEITAEGVETAEQCKIMAQMGVNLGQGYFFSRPVEASAVPELVADWG